MSSAQIFTHQLPSKIESLGSVEQIIEDIKNIHGIPEELYGNILVAVTEAVNNGIRHGNNLDESLLLELAFEFSDSEFSFVIQDQGTGFDFQNVPDPTHPDNIEKPDGRGIFIMETLSDEVKFTENGSTVSIKFFR